MSYLLTSSLGVIESVIDDNCGMKKFNSIAHALLKELKVKFIGKVDDSDTIDWNFKYKGHPLTLHYNIYNGVSIFSLKKVDNRYVTEVTKFVESKIF